MYKCEEGKRKSFIQVNIEPAGCRGSREKLMLEQRHVYS